MAWPSVLIPFGYIPAGLLILTAASTLIAGLSDSDIWDTVSVVSCIFPLIMTVAIACTTIQQYVDKSIPKTSMLVMGIINVIIAFLCLIHSILLCIDLRFCFMKETLDPLPEIQPNIPKLTLNDALITKTEINHPDVDDNIITSNNSVNAL
ncbi:unnamed protein product [Heterobilharzia americana]|nr:unnamed protein product [Heterobilharzia americana]